MKRISFFFLSYVCSLFLAKGGEFDQVQKVPYLHAPIWNTFSLSEVELTDSYFKQAMERHKGYVLSLEVDRLIPHIRKRSGLEPKGQTYGGWEKNGGCTFGHYMSSCALFYAAEGDRRFLERLDYMLSELKECQENVENGWFITSKRNVQGYWDLLGGNLALNQPDETKQPWNFNKNGNSWYCVHKILAGLRDAYCYAGREQAKDILIPLVDFISDFALQANSDLFQGMLAVEQGGMNEVLADVYAFTGNEKYLKAAERFNHINVVYPSANREDVLFGRHANDQIPKFIGAARQYEFVDNELYKNAAINFWDIVLEKHTTAIGANSCYERFGIPGEESKRLDYSSAETCNTYNMLKLSRQLFQLTEDIKYLNYYEHALYNHILASQDPDMPGCVTYYTALMPGLFKQYSTPYESFWCCVGTGMENHAKYAESVYFAKDNELLINLFIPSRLSWKSKELQLTLDTRFPESDTIRIKLDKKGKFTGNISVRIPKWLQTNAQYSVNGKKGTIGNSTDGFIRLDGRSLNDGDEICLVFPRSLHIRYAEDEPHFGTIMYGPLVLAGALGSDGMPDDRVSDNRGLKGSLPARNIPIMVVDPDRLNAQIIESLEQPLQFTVKNGEKQPNIQLLPYFQMHHQRYTVYWKIYAPEVFKKRSNALTDEIYIDDDITNEKKHNLQGKNDTVRFHDYFWAKNTQFRDARNGGYFSYDLKINKKEQGNYYLICRYWGDESPNHEFDVLIDNNLLKTVNLNRRLYLTYVDDIYEIPSSWTQGKDKVKVTFRANEEKTAGGLYSLKITSDPNLR